MKRIVIIFCLLCIPSVLFAGGIVDKLKSVIARQTVAGEAQAEEISDDFSTDPHGTRWENLTTLDNESYASGQWTINDDRAYYHATELSSADYYVKWKVVSRTLSDGSTIMLRSSGTGSDGYYGVTFWADNNAYLGDWDEGAWSADLDNAAAFAISDGDSVGVTIEGTGTATTIRMWDNPTNNTPYSVEYWDNDSDSPEATLSASGGWSVYHNTGKYVGIGTQNGNIVIDDVYAGVF